MNVKIQYLLDRDGADSPLELCMALAVKQLDGLCQPRTKLLVHLLHILALQTHMSTNV